MRRSTLFISAAITAFVLAMLVGVVVAYRHVVSNKTQAAGSKQTVMIQTQDAATIASHFINRTDLYSIELADFNGVQTYKVTFSSGDIVYVSLSGQVFGAQPPPAPVVIVVKKNGGGGGGAPAAPAPVVAPPRGGGGNNGGD